MAKLHQLLGELTAYPQVKDCMVVGNYRRISISGVKRVNAQVVVKVSEEPLNIGGGFNDELFSLSRVKACKSR